jgi:hypothetical protein
VVGNEELVELFDRYARLPGEQVEQLTSWSGVTGVLVRTDRRLLSLRVDPAALSAAKEPWVAALVVLEREDLLGHGEHETHAVLLGRDGRDHHLNDPAAVAALGAHLDPAAFAEILVAYHPWSPARRELSTEPAVTRVAGGRRMTFWSTEVSAPAPGALLRTAAFRWQVELPDGGPARWDRARG